MLRFWRTQRSVTSSDALSVSKTCKCTVRRRWSTIHFPYAFLSAVCVCVPKIVEMNVHMDCEGCEKRVRKAMSRLEGASTVSCV